MAARLEAAADGGSGTLPALLKALRERPADVQKVLRKVLGNQVHLWSGGFAAAGRNRATYPPFQDDVWPAFLWKSVPSAVTSHHESVHLCRLPRKCCTFAAACRWWMCSGSSRGRRQHSPMPRTRRKQRKQCCCRWSCGGCRRWEAAVAAVARRASTPPASQRCDAPLAMLKFPAG